MLIKYGAIVTEGAGSLGGHTLQHSKGGNQLRTKPIPRGTPSASQYVIRSLNPLLQEGWKQLTDAQRKIWNDYPIVNGIFNSKGDKHPLSGHSIWMKYQYYQVLYSLPFLSDPSKFTNPPELLQTWQQDSFYVFSPFNVSGYKILFAKANLDYGACNGLPAFSGLAGDRFEVRISLSAISDVIPYFALINLNPPSYISNINSIIARNSYHVFTLNQNSSDIHLYIAVLLSYIISVTYCSLKKLP